MREDCKHFQSRTYASGEAARFCVLDLAPEAPWKCPEGCTSFELRTADAGWTHGSLQAPPVEEEPDLPYEDSTALLDEAEDVVNAAVPAAMAEALADERRRRSWWRRWSHRRD